MTAPNDAMLGARRAWLNAQRGDFRAAVEVGPRLAALAEPGARAWSLALDAQRWTADSTGGRRIDVADVEACSSGGGEARSVAALACVEGERWALLSYDVPELERWMRLHRSLCESASPEASRWYRWAVACMAVAGGRWAEAVEEATELESQAAAAAEPALVIESATLRALGLLCSGDFSEATRHARRASRMARTEAMPQQEYFANLVLARVRRMTGHPHLATRILRALQPLASPVWQDWVRWELVMAGALETAVEVPRPPGDTPGPSFSEALVELVLAADGGNREGFDEAARTFRSPCGVAPFDQEIEVVLAACDVRRPLVGQELFEWASGHTDATPPLLHGILTRPGAAPQGESTLAYVVAHPDVGRRRIPRLGWGLADLPGLHALGQTRRKQGRVETLVSALLLAGDEGLEETRCFETIYGFAYEPAMHKGVFDVLLHRARGYMGDAGELRRTDGRVALDTDTPLLVPDPRCTKAMQDRLLRAVAEQPGATAKDVAASLGVSLRVAQAALQELAQAGACAAKREGRQLRYVVEDTTFSEPTNCQ